MTRLTKPQRQRLQHLQRPGLPRQSTGNPTTTDRCLAEKGLVKFVESHVLMGHFATVITAEGRESVEPDEWEYCGSCQHLTHIKECACLECGATKESWT